MSDLDTLQSIGQQANAFQRGFASLQLATTNRAGVPEASYAPFVAHGNQLYVYVSELAAHCANLRDTGRCCAMFIESEAQAKHPFARQRLTLHCAAREVPREDAHFSLVLAMFHDRFGKFMDMLGKLTDFHLIALTPERGNYVAGFAKAYRLTGENLSEVTHRTEKGHATPDAATSAAMSALAG